MHKVYPADENTGSIPIIPLLLNIAPREMLIASIISVITKVNLFLYANIFLNRDTELVVTPEYDNRAILVKMANIVLPICQYIKSILFFFTTETAVHNEARKENMFPMIK